VDNNTSNKPEKDGKEPTPDFTIARRTLKFLGKQLRTEQFTLKANIKRKKLFERQENEARKRIGKLKERIEREIDMNPGIFEGIIGEED
jgi:hypothetical protein